MTTKIKLRDLQTAAPSMGEAVRIPSKSIPIHDGLDRSMSLSKALFGVATGANSTNAPGTTGTLEHPFDMSLANRMPQVSAYHSACQRTLVAFAVGQGIGVIDEEATEERRKMQEGMGEVDSASMLPVIDEAGTRQFYDFFDDVTEHGFDHAMNQLGQNFFNIGNGYFELGRDGSKTISGLWWMPGQLVWKHQLDPDDSRSYCWKHNPYDSYSHSTTGTSYLRKHGSDGSEFGEGGGVNGIKVHPNEVLDFQMPTTAWRHYGAPGWLAAVPPIEVDWRAMQRVSDYMNNNGVPETMIVLGGVKLSPDQNAAVRAALSGGGGENYGKGAFLNFPNGSKDRLFFEVKQLGQSLEGSGWNETHATVNLIVASSNQVPPILAGITVAGKMGASNEQVLAMVVLQNTVIGPAQKYLAQRLSRCLLGRKCGGPAGLVGRRLRFRTILEASDIVALNTVARQREQVAEKPNRDPKEGLKRG